jgi:hypothetical protein
VKPEKDAPSAKPKDNITRISNLLVKSAMFDETLGLERSSLRIDFLITSHAPVIAISVNALHTSKTKESQP